MEQNMQIFENEQFGKIRTAEIAGVVWFVGKDVAKALGYSNTKHALSVHVDVEDKRDGVAFRDPIGRLQNPLMINESGMYSLIFSSRLAIAKSFKRWITSEVIPSIRKHGAYINDELLEEIAANKEAAEKLFRELKEEKEKNSNLSDKLDELNEKLEADEPKCEYYDNVLQAQDLIPMTLIAKDYGMSATRLNAMLYAFGVQYRMNCGTWVLYADYQDMGYTKTVTIFPRYDYNNAILVMYWTHSGREFLYRFLKEHGILPMSEIGGDN
ncbi:MAG: phage antirepressor KilAC domain-containing protein [Eubacterium sp.]|nr:phage antirepressor KilAC domain-containing protein [Eubacterium sp.]